MDELNILNIFRSYYEAAQSLSDNERLALYDAIMQYGFDGIVPELSGPVKIYFMLIKPTLDKSKARSMAGSKGGKSKSQSNDKQNDNQDASKDEICLPSKTEANEKQTQSKDEICLSSKSEFCPPKEKEKEKEEGGRKAPLPPELPLEKPKPLLGAVEYLGQLGHAPPPEGDKYLVLLEALFGLADTFPADQRDRDYVYRLFTELIKTYGDRNILRTVQNLTDHQRAPSPRVNRGKPYVRLGATLRNWLDNERPEIEEGGEFYERVQE
jgi:hypothetical protein